MDDRFLLGGIFVSLHGTFKNKIRTIAGCLVGFGVCFALLGIAGNFLVYLLFMGAAGLFMPVIATAQTVLIQETVQPAMLGRVFSIVQMISAGAMPVAILFFGPLADLIAVETILIVSGAFLGWVGIWYHRSNARHVK